MALCGALSLNRNGENAGARNDRRADGVQKFSSVISECSAQNLYQPSSVMAMVPSTAQSYILIALISSKTSTIPTTSCLIASFPREWKGARRDDHPDNIQPTHWWYNAERDRRESAMEGPLGQLLTFSSRKPGIRDIPHDRLDPSRHPS
jgi:hypothetical protein